MHPSLIQAGHYFKEEVNMLKQLLVGSSVFVVLFAGSVSAQEPQAPEAQPQPQQAPQDAPQDAPQNAPTTEVSQSELEQFVRVIPQLQEIQQSAQQQAAQVIQESGLSTERFSEIYQSQQSGATPSAEVTSEEQQSYDEASTKIESLEQDVRSQQEEVLQTEGLEPQRFGEILVAVRQDPTLQQQVQELLQSGQ